MRGIAWRRHVSDKIMKKKIKFFSKRFDVYRFSDANGLCRENPDWIDWIGTKLTHKIMSVGAPWENESSKYSSNRGELWYKWDAPGKSRIADKKYFRSIMKEYYEN
jgi:hypothetical protein